MTDEPYHVADSQAMLRRFDVSGPLIGLDGPLVPTAGRALLDYLRIAPGRSRSSLAKVALGIAVHDIWTGFGDETTAGSSEVEELITIAAATARRGPTDNDAGEVVRSVRARVERVAKVDPVWQEVWSAASAVGRQTGFRLEVDAARADLVWRALIAFAASPAPLTLPPIPPGTTRMLERVRSRVEATSPEALASIKDGWRARPSESTLHEGPGSELPREPAPQYQQRVSQVQDDAQDLTVWFGTNREPTVRSNPLSRYANALARDELFYGRCVVNIPAARDATGGLRRYVSGWLRRGSPHGSRPQVDSRLRFDDEAEFVKDLESELSHHDQERTALVFIHGYGTSFDRAAASAAQLSANLKHRGPTAMFSWASRASLLHYRHDERMVDESRTQLVRFLQTLSSITELEHIDLVAHSLGNRLFLRSLIDWFGTAPPPGAPLRNLFLGAPDVAQSEMLRSAPMYARIAAKTTMYGSDSDSALFASKLINGEARAGLMPPPLLTTGIDTIETSAIDASNLRHNGLIDAGPIQTDIVFVQEGRLDPDTRPRLRRVSAGHPLPYWRF